VSRAALRRAAMTSLAVFHLAPPLCATTISPFFTIYAPEFAALPLAEIICY
jgi:hypothetical protein